MYKSRDFLEISDSCRTHQYGFCHVVGITTLRKRCVGCEAGWRQMSSGRSSTNWSYTATEWTRRTSEWKLLGPLLWVPKHMVTIYTNLNTR